MKLYRKKLVELAECFGLDLQFADLQGQANAFFVKKWSMIVIENQLNRQQTLTSFFHELGHAFCNTSGKYKVYHDIKNPHKMTTEELSIFTRTALKAERYVDKIGAEMMKLYYPNVEYAGGYEAYGADIYLKYFQMEYWIELNRRNS